MHIEFGITLFYFTVHVSLIHLLHVETTRAATCVGPSNSTRVSHFYAFKSLRPSNEHAFGCASDSAVISAGNSHEVYQENHVINVKNDRTADIYLNINRTKDSLPHYNEYKYEFALFSRKDVIWLVSTENLPSNGVFFKFYYYPSGSHIVFRDGRQVSSVYVDFDDPKHMTSRDIFNWCKNQGIFLSQQITSFTEISVSAVATVNVVTGNKQGALFSLGGNFTGCTTVDRAYTSPVVAVGQCKTTSPLLNCQQTFLSKGGTKRKKAFVLDVIPESSSTERMQIIINLELVGTAPSGDASGAAEKTLVVLSSTGPIEWRAHFERKINAANFLFVVSSNSKLVVDGVSRNVELEYVNFDYDETNPTVLTNSVETLYDSTVVSYSQYNDSADLIFLKLTDFENDPDAGFSNRDSLLDKAQDIFVQSTLTCEDSFWSLTVPMKILDRYNLTEENLELSSGDSVCQAMILSDPFYDLTSCSTVSEDGVRNVDMKITFKLKTSNHFFTVPGSRSETRTIPLKGCQKQKTDGGLVDNSGLTAQTLRPQTITGAVGETPEIASFCAEQLFVIRIPNQLLQGTLDITELSKCYTHLINGDREYTIKSDSVSTCGARFAKGVNKITIPRKPSFDGASRQAIEVSCSYRTEEVTMNYHLRVFEDFNLRNLLTGTIPVKPAEEDTDETTYHFQVSGVSNDRSLTVYLSSCSLKQGIRETLLIKNNCPAGKDVSFVRSASKFANQTQHFALKMGRLLVATNDGRPKVACVVGACALVPCDHCIPSVPQCTHLHGDGCSESSADSQMIIAPYLTDTVFSPRFKLSERTGVDTRRAKSPDEEANDARGPEEDQATVLSATTDATKLVALTLFAFLLGCALVGVLAFIRRRYPRKQSSLRKSESEGSGSDGSGDTALTKTTGRKSSSSSSSPTSSKDDLEMERKPFIEAPSSAPATGQPRIVEVRSKFTFESDDGTSSACYGRAPCPARSDYVDEKGSAGIRGSADPTAGHAPPRTNGSRGVRAAVYVRREGKAAAPDLKSAASESPGRRGPDEDGRCVPPAPRTNPTQAAEARSTGLKEVAV